MGFFADAGRIYITDPNDAEHVVFDTNERLFIATDYVAGTVVTPQRQASSQNGGRIIVDVDVTTVLASINAAADTVFGAYRIESPDAQTPADAGWYQATGSQLIGRWHIPHSQIDVIGGHAIFTFSCAGGQLRFHERTFIKTVLNNGGSLLTSTLLSQTIHYKLYCGSFV